MPTRCRHVAQSGRRSHRRQDGAQGRARGGAAAPGPQAQEAPLLHGPGRQVLPEPAGPRLRGGGPDGQAGGRRRRIQGGRREAPPFARGRPLQRRGRRLLDIRVPEHGDGPPGCRRASRAGPMAETPRRRIRTWAGSTGCPPAGSRSSGRGSPGPCPAKETASTTRRPRTSSRRPRPSLAAIGRDGPDVFEGDPEKHIDRYSNVRIKRRLDGSGPVEYGLGRAA